MLESCTVTVSFDGLVIEYKWAESPVSGRDSYSDEDVSEWRDNDIRQLAADLIGAEGDDVDKIEIVRD